VALPLPAATSSTRSPEQMSAASASDSPTICNVVPTTAKSPLAHVACCFCLMAARFGAAAVVEAGAAMVLVMMVSP